MSRYGIATIVSICVAIVVVGTLIAVGMVFLKRRKEALRRKYRTNSPTTKDDIEL
jgi:hypothetical protein